MYFVIKPERHVPAKNRLEFIFSPPWPLIE